MRVRMRMLGLVAICIVALVSGGVGSWAQKDAGKAGEAPAMTPEQQKEMEAWMKLATPGEAHKKLGRCVGTFDAKVKMWFAPGTPPQESTGVDEAKWVLEGRFIEDTFTGTAMGMPFTGMGLTGYDNHKKKYVGVWTDTWSTFIQSMSGDMDATGNTLTMTSMVFDPMKGKDKKLRAVQHWVDEKIHTYETFEVGPDGKEFKSMEITFTRR